MNRKLTTLLLVCSLIIPMGMTGCFDDDYEEPAQQETTEATETTTEESEPTTEETESTTEETAPSTEENEPSTEETESTETPTEPDEEDDYGQCLHSDAFNNIVLSSENVDYALYGADYYEKLTSLYFCFDFIGSPLADGETDYHNYDAVAAAFDEDWQNFAKDFVLTVDGTEYAPTDTDSYASYCYQENEYFEAGTCGTFVDFPAIDYDSAEIITLTAGENVYNLKAPVDYTSGTPWICSNIDGVITEDTPANLKDDFYLYVNKDALLSEEITEDRHSAGTMMDVVYKVDDDLMTMFQGDAPQDHDEKLAYDMYKLATDWDTRNALGAAPLKAKTDIVEAIDSLDAMTAYCSTGDEGTLWNCFYYTGTEDTDHNYFYFTPCSLLRWDSAEYENPTPEMEQAASPYWDFTRTVLVKAGYTEEEAQQKIDNSLAWEAMLAPAISTYEEQAEYQYYLDMAQPYSREDLAALGGQLPLFEGMTAHGFPDQDTYFVIDPQFFEQLNVVYTEENLTLMKDHLIVNLVASYAERLDYETCEMYYSLYDPDNDGLFEMKSDEDYGLFSVENQLPWAVTQYYTRNYLSQEDKDRISEIIDEVIFNYHDILNEADFISDETRAMANEKLDNIKKFVLYPDNLEDLNYAGLDFSSVEEGGTYFDAVDAIILYNEAQVAATFNDPIDKTQWVDDPQCMPYVVNCFNNLTTNSIYILGGFAQGDLYNSEMSDEELYGTLGAVIGHEISHSFDINGSMFDKDGNMTNWWTEEDYNAFLDRNQKMIDYFDNQIKPWAGQDLDGANLAGETCADMGAIKCMLRMASKKPDFDYDTFFRTYAKMWNYKVTSDRLDYCLADEHPLEYIRVNLVLQQFDEFLDFYGITEGDGMYLAPENRILIW